MGKIGSICKMQLLAVLSIVLLSSGCGSSSSDSTPADTSAPSTPTYLTAVAASDIKVTLRWLASTDNIGVTAYTINRDGVQIATTTTATTVYSDVNRTPVTVYTYTVAARDAAGNSSAPSSSATTTTLGSGFLDGSAPTWQGTLSATALNSSQISLSWSPATDNVGVSGYNIYRGDTSNAKVKVGTSTTTSYTDTGLTSGKEYFYVVKAFDGVPNESDASNEVSPTTL